jgi:hypothetical protein
LVGAGQGIHCSVIVKTLRWSTKKHEEVLITLLQHQWLLILHIFCSFFHLSSWAGDQKKEGKIRSHE